MRVFYWGSPIFELRIIMKILLVGLGNVGDEYAHTRHNIGFDVVNAFVQRHQGQFRVDRLAYVADIKWKGKQFVCICPTTYMNLSGKAVKYWMDKEKADLSSLLVIVDDLALPLDTIRLKPGGSDAGHNGLKSIQESLGTTQYAKLRFGIGNDYPKGKQADFVLSKWKSTEEKQVSNKIMQCVDAIEVVATQGLDVAMNQFNQKSFT
jgi:peptidyl-tRNA hydrolase, PTH1 family